MLVCLPFTVYAASDSTSIGLSVVIKAKQSCDYSYALENNANMSDSRNTHFSTCDINASRLQLQANQIAIAEFKTTQTEIDGKRLRVFMTVQ